MKAFSTVAALLATATLGACTKANDVETLHGEAVAMSKYYAPRVDALDARLQAIFKRGSTISASTPGVEAVSTRLTSARDVVLTLHQAVTPGPDGKSALLKEADEAAKTRNIERLEGLLHEKEETLSRGVLIANDDLSAAESWLAQYDRHTLAMPAPPPAPPPATEPPPPPPTPTAGSGSAAPAPTGATAGSAAPAPTPPAAGRGSAAPAEHAAPAAGSAARPHR